MSMSVGGGSGGPKADINMTPMIDVLLVLIIIFMVITPNVPVGLPTVIPQPAPAQSSPELPDPHTVVVQLMQDGKLMINQEQSDWDRLGARLSDIFKERADKLAFFEGSDDVAFADVARAIDIMRGAGIEQVGLITPAGNIRQTSLRGRWVNLEPEQSGAQKPNSRSVKASVKCAVRYDNVLLWELVDGVSRLRICIQLFLQLANK